MRSPFNRACLRLGRLGIMPIIVLLLLPCGGCEALCRSFGLPNETCNAFGPFGARKTEDLQVAIEVRFIGVSDDFFNRIGVDFNFNLNSDAQLGPADTSNPLPPNNHPANAFVTSPSQVGGQDNAQMFVPRTILDTTFFLPAIGQNGSAPQAGHFPRLPAMTKIPLTGLFSPPNLDDFPGGAVINGAPNVDAVSIGFALLSDIEAFFFLQAAQGDNRNNILTAPKLTLFHDQSAATISMNEMTTINDVEIPFAQKVQEFIPLVQNVHSGPMLGVKPVISADRRLVQLYIRPIIAIVANGPIIQSGGVGHTLQFPVVQFTGVQTTVTVPDGGTVLLGGIRKAAGGPLERGVPILAKVPYLNRLFKNDAAIKDTQPLLIMVTPRIIIQSD